MWQALSLAHSLHSFSVAWSGRVGIQHKRFSSWATKSMEPRKHQNGGLHATQHLVTPNFKLWLLPTPTCSSLHFLFICFGASSWLLCCWMGGWHRQTTGCARLFRIFFRQDLWFPNKREIMTPRTPGAAPPPSHTHPSPHSSTDAHSGAHPSKGQSGVSSL